MAAAEVTALVAEVQRSAKYRTIAASLIARIGAEELAKGRSSKDAVKATKARLHQVAGAYLPERVDAAGWLVRLAAQVQDPAAVQRLCRELMARHASTRERLPILDQFYATLFADLPCDVAVLDLACGLNPLALPWMPLAGRFRYTACDIYADQAELLNGFFQALGVDGEARVCDLTQTPALPPADVVLLLKAVPCLDHLDRTLVGRLLDTLDATWVYVSFPSHSLGGRSKGMPAQYEPRLAQLVAGQVWQVERYSFGSELVFRLRIG